MRYIAVLRLGDETPTEEA